MFASVILVRVCSGPRFVLQQVLLILLVNLSNIGRIISIRRYFGISDTVGDIMASVFGLVYYTTEVAVYWSFVFKYYNTSTKVNQIIAKHAENIRNMGKRLSDRWTDKERYEKKQRVLALKRHLRQRTRECKALIYIVLVFLIVLVWMILSLIHHNGRCHLTDPDDVKCQFE